LESPKNWAAAITRGSGGHLLSALPQYTQPLLALPEELILYDALTFGRLITWASSDAPEFGSARPKSAKKVPIQNIRWSLTKFVAC
jgi:hypothetical protein